MALPQLSNDQKLEALKRAQAIRRERSNLRSRLKRGETTLEEVLMDTDPVTARMKVAYLLRSLPRIGKVKAKKIMEEIGIDESRRVKGLGRRQREALVSRLGSKAM
ncbi:MAG TPA: integration host factor [Clostridia bacterium]|nr:integration host factor [Clostridia bacterium]